LDVMCVAEQPQGDTFVLIRGNPASPGDKVEAGFPEVLAGTAAAKVTPPASGTTAGKRLALANWIVSDENPTAARAMANRLWQYHFGRGIVPSSNDFGKLGELPTHPELLDWLAVELREGGWKLKRMHKL